MFRPVRLTLSLGLAWAFARQRIDALHKALGLGPLAIRAFLRRDSFRLLEGELTRLETLVRRILFLAAMDRPLPKAPAPCTPGQGASTKEPPQKEDAAPQHSFIVPAFRLEDPAGRSAQGEGQAPAVAGTDANPLPEDDAPPRPWEMLPAARLFNRLAALQNALADPAAEVARFRRKLARIRVDKALPMPVADRPPPACVGPDVWPVRRELFWVLHDAALSWLPILDTG